MTTYHGLYHPHIHFQDEGWLKLAALYWDGIFRIVPSAIVPEDDDQVKKLIGAGVINSRHPGMGASSISEPFRTLISTRGDELSHKFGVQPSTSWTALDHIHAEKMDEQLVQDLINSGLARGEGDWLGMQPQLANVYMTALAEVMAPMIGARPIAEKSIEHIAVSGLTMERLSEALLGRAEMAVSNNGVEVAMASLAISYVIPENPASIPAEEIIRFRDTYIEERAQFQAEVNKVVEGLSYLKDIKNPRDIEMHLQNEYKKKIGPKLERLKRAMEQAAWDTVDSTTAASFAVPQGLAAAFHALGFVLTGGVTTALGVALSGWTIWRKHKKATADVLKPSAETFLYRIERSLRPEAVARQVLQDSRRFLPYA